MIFSPFLHVLQGLKRVLSNLIQESHTLHMPIFSIVNSMGLGLFVLGL